MIFEKVRRSRSMWGRGQKDRGARTSGSPDALLTCGLRRKAFPYPSGVASSLTQGPSARGRAMEADSPSFLLRNSWPGLVLLLLLLLFLFLQLLLLVFFLV